MWGFSLFFYASFVLATPFIEDAQVSLATAPSESLVLFQQAPPKLHTLPTDEQIEWYKVAIQANRSLYDIDKSYEYSQHLHANYWEVADETDKLFII